MPACRNVFFSVKSTNEKGKHILLGNEESRETVPVSKLNAAFFNTCTDQASTCLLIWHLAAFHPY